PVGDRMGKLLANLIATTSICCSDGRNGLWSLVFGLWFWLFLTMQVLREVVGNAHFLDGMKLSLQIVRVPLFVLNHVLEQSPGAVVLYLGADLHGLVVLAHRIQFVL